jgi:hypothetical protein
VDAASVDVGSPAFNDFVKSPALLDRAISGNELRLHAGREDRFRAF